MPVKLKNQFAVCAALLAVWALAHAAEPTGTAEKFVVPDYDAAGNLRWRLVGDQGQLTTNGTLLVVNARAELYQSNRVAAVVSAPHCELDRAAGGGKTDGPIRLERGNFIVTGIGGAWDSQTASVVIYSNVQLVVQNITVEKKP